MRHARRPSAPEAARLTDAQVAFIHYFAMTVAAIALFIAVVSGTVDMGGLASASTIVFVLALAFAWWWHEG